MDQQLLRAIDELRALRIPALKARYRELYGEESKSSNKQYLFRRIAWRLQANALGGLSDRALQRIGEIVDDRDIRARAPREFLDPESSSRIPLPQRDWRLPPPGTLLTRRVGDKKIVVKILTKGFEYESRCYQSLSAIAREVTGTRWNGLLFFGLAERRNG